MIGVLAISHGKMAEGMLDAAHMFFGDDLPGVEALCFMSSDNPEDFDVKLKDAVARVNTGDGVIIFADLMGGTPANRSMYVLGDHWCKYDYDARTTWHKTCRRYKSI